MNNDYKRILVMGAGAVGGYFGGRLAEGTSSEVVLVARGAHLQALRDRGLHLKSIDGDARLHIPATDDPAAAGPADLVLFTVKSYDTHEAIRQVRPAVGPHTQVLTLQNGIENYPALAEAFGEERVIQGFCKIGAGVPEPGVVEHKAFGEITFGEQDGSKSERLIALRQLLKRAGLQARLSPEIRKEVWLKFSWNCVFNMLTAAAMVTVDRLFETPESESLCHALFGELRAVARPEGVELTEEEGERLVASGRHLEGFETSTYQDRMKGKPMEFDAFTGAVVRLADKHGVEVPVHRTLYALLKLTETHNRS